MLIKLALEQRYKRHSSEAHRLLTNVQLYSPEKIDFHMLIETANDEIWKIMQKLLSLYVRDLYQELSREHKI
jgi:hypothetical protein